MERKNKILQAIVKHFIDTAEPVGSNTLIVSYKFQVSPATIRNDMASLEKEGLIFQPHTSAGRIPTDQGYRRFVEDFADYKKAREVAIKTLKGIQKEHKVAKARERAHDAVSLLSKATNNVSFASTPEETRSFYLGISNVLRQPEFMSDTMRASRVIEMLENNDNFVNTLKALDIDETVKIYIGHENIIEPIQSCTIMVTKYNFEGYEGYIGILGPTRMHYAFNVCMLEEVKKLLESNNSMT